MSQLTDEIEALCALEPLPDSPSTILLYAADAVRRAQAAVRRAYDTYAALAGAGAAVPPAPAPPLYMTLVTTDDAGELARQLVCAASQLAREGYSGPRNLVLRHFWCIGLSCTQVAATRPFSL